MCLGEGHLLFPGMFPVLKVGEAYTCLFFLFIFKLFIHILCICDVYDIFHNQLLTPAVNT